MIAVRMEIVFCEKPPFFSVAYYRDQEKGSGNGINIPNAGVGGFSSYFLHRLKSRYK